LPIAERNRLLLAGGFAPPYLEQPYDGEVMRPLRESLSRLLKAYEPNPALIVDGLWNLIAQGGADRTRCGDPASLHTTRVGMGDDRARRCRQGRAFDRDPARALRARGRAPGRTCPSALAATSSNLTAPPLPGSPLSKLAFSTCLLRAKGAVYRERAQGTSSLIPSMLPSLSRNQAARSPLPLLG
jgi:hypothetical protein